MKFNKYQEEVLHGLMLGDGHISKNNLNGNPQYTQTFGQHGELFANYIFSTFKNFCTPKGLYSYKVQSGKNSPFYLRFIVRTRALPVLQPFVNIYYTYNIIGKRIKILPLEIENLLTPVVLAIFVMCDGNYHKPKKVIRLYTNNFTKKEVDLLSYAIYNKFNIETRVEHDRKEQYILVIRKSQVPKFQQLVSSHIIPSMLYRIGL
jgi:LAGLIDADG DNA endonuclease family